MTAIMLTLLGALVFAASTAIDYAAARWARAVDDGQRIAASMWTLIQWGATMISFITAIEVTMWILPFEGAGLALGSYLGTRPGTSRGHGRVTGT